MKVNKYIASPPVEGRECGDCTACCVLPRIHANAMSLPLLPEGKPGYTKCQHLCESGCGRYEERPPVCVEFKCLWREGQIAGDDRRRPDKLGLMLTVELYDGNPWIEVWELWTGASRDHPGRGVLDALHEATNKVMVRYYGVPCSLQYGASVTVENGVQLSIASAEHPEALARWVKRKMQTQQLECDPDEPALLDLASLESGVPIEAHFNRR